MPDRIAEVIASSTHAFQAEVYRSVPVPAFGTWVHAACDDGSTLLALVSHVEIGSVEPGRQVTAYGLTPDELRHERPHVLELLRTTFRAQVVAHRTPGGALRQALPPFPAPVHGFVLACCDDDVVALGPPYDFLRVLVSNPDPLTPVDELLVAVLGQIRRAHGGGEQGSRALIEAGRVLARLLRDDHERLGSILRRAT